MLKCMTSCDTIVLTKYIQGKNIMEKIQLKNIIYISVSAFIILLMSILTWFYLNNKITAKSNKIATQQVVKIDNSTSMSTTVNSSIMESGNNSMSESSSTLMSSVELTNETSTSMTETSLDNQTVSEFRFLYTAVGGDTLYTISELTGVNVATIADVNGLSQDAVLVADQKIYVP